jgi:hypothetical protein
VGIRLGQALHLYLAGDDAGEFQRRPVADAQAARRKLADVGLYIGAGGFGEQQWRDEAGIEVVHCHRASSRAARIKEALSCDHAGSFFRNDARGATGRFGCSTGNKRTTRMVYPL